MPTIATRPRLGEPTLFELVSRLALAASPRQLALTGLFQLAGAVAIVVLAPARWWCAMPMLAFAAASAWGLAAQTGREATGARASALAAVRVIAAVAGVLAMLAFALGFFLGALGTSWIS